MPSFLHHMWTSVAVTWLLMLLHQHDSGITIWGGRQKMPFCHPSWTSAVWHIVYLKLCCTFFGLLCIVFSVQSILIWDEVKHPVDHLIIRSCILRVIIIGLDYYGPPNNICKRCSHNTVMIWDIFWWTPLFLLYQPCWSNAASLSPCTCLCLFWLSSRCTVFSCSPVSS